MLYYQKKKKKPDGTEAAFLKMQLQSWGAKRSLTWAKCGFSASLQLRLVNAAIGPGVEPRSCKTQLKGKAIAAFLKNAAKKHGLRMRFLQCEMMTEDIMITRVANHQLQLHQKIVLIHLQKPT